MSKYQSMSHLIFFLLLLTTSLILIKDVNGLGWVGFGFFLCIDIWLGTFIIITRIASTSNLVESSENPLILNPIIFNFFEKLLIYFFSTPQNHIIINLCKNSH
jgi:hypothetical protein